MNIHLWSKTWCGLIDLLFYSPWLQRSDNTQTYLPNGISLLLRDPIGAGLAVHACALRSPAISYGILWRWHTILLRYSNWLYFQYRSHKSLSYWRRVPQVYFSTLSSLKSQRKFLLHIELMWRIEYNGQHYELKITVSKSLTVCGNTIEWKHVLERTT